MVRQEVKHLQKMDLRTHYGSNFLMKDVENGTCDIWAIREPNLKTYKIEDSRKKTLHLIVSIISTMDGKNLRKIKQGGDDCDDCQKIHNVKKSMRILKKYGIWMKTMVGKNYIF